jgi:hypothetical protein
LSPFFSQFLWKEGEVSQFQEEASKAVN